MRRRKLFSALVAAAWLPRSVAGAAQPARAAERSRQRALAGSRQESERSGLHRPWKIAVGLNGFASSSRKYQKLYPIWEVLDFIARSGFDGVELVGGWPMGPYPHAKEETNCRAAQAQRRLGPAGVLDPDGSSLGVCTGQAGPLRLAHALSRPGEVRRGDRLRRYRHVARLPATRPDGRAGDRPARQLVPPGSSDRCRPRTYRRIRDRATLRLQHRTTYESDPRADGSAEPESDLRPEPLRLDARLDRQAPCNAASGSRTSGTCT